MNKTDAMLGVFFAFFSLIGLVVIVPRQTFSFGMGGGLSPSFFPNTILVIMGGLSVLLAATNIVKLLTGKANQVIRTNELKKFLRTCIVTVGCCVAFYLFGFIIAGPLVVALTMALMRVRDWRMLLAVSVASPAAIYTVFGILLEKPMLTGVLFN